MLLLVSLNIQLVHCRVYVCVFYRAINGEEQRWFFFKKKNKNSFLLLTNCHFSCYIAVVHVYINMWAYYIFKMVHKARLLSLMCVSNCEVNEHRFLFDIICEHWTLYHTHKHTNAQTLSERWRDWETRTKSHSLTVINHKIFILHFNSQLHLK